MLKCTVWARLLLRVTLELLAADNCIDFGLITHYLGILLVLPLANNPRTTVNTSSLKYIHIDQWESRSLYLLLG